MFALIKNKTMTDILGKILIAFLSAIFALMLKAFFDNQKEVRRINILKVSIKGLIDDSILGALKYQKDNFKEFYKNIDTEIFFDDKAYPQYPWLTSKVFDFFSKEDLTKILNDIGNQEFSKYYRKTKELDFMYENSIYINKEGFKNFVISFFEKNNFFDSETRKKCYFSGEYHELEFHKKTIKSNLKMRINQSDSLIIYFEELSNNLIVKPTIKEVFYKWFKKTS